MQSWFVALSFVIVSLFAGDALANLRRKIFLGVIRLAAARLDAQTEATLPGYVSAFGATCSMSVRVPDGATLTIREQCTGASWSFWSGVTCPATCRQTQEAETLVLIPIRIHSKLHYDKYFLDAGNRRHFVFEASVTKCA